VLSQFFVYEDQFYLHIICKIKQTDSLRYPELIHLSSKIFEGNIKYM